MVSESKLRRKMKLDRGGRTTNIRMVQGIRPHSENKVQVSC